MFLVQGLLTCFPSLNSASANAKMYVASTTKALTNTPGFVLIRTSSNEQFAQVKIGMVYRALVLESPRLGRAIQPVSQPLEKYKERTHLYTRIHQTYAKSGETYKCLFALVIRHKKRCERCVLT
ncbi:MAG: hypothetical protein ACRC5C_05825 [Bacilli bacterium]